MRTNTSAKWCLSHAKQSGVILLGASFIAMGVACSGQTKTRTIGVEADYLSASSPEHEQLLAEWNAALRYARWMLAITDAESTGRVERSKSINLGIEPNVICESAAWAERYAELGCFKALQAWLYPYSTYRWKPERGCGPRFWCPDPDLEGVIVDDDRRPFAIRAKEELEKDELREIRLLVMGAPESGADAPRPFQGVSGPLTGEVDTIAVLRWYDEFLGYTRELNSTGAIKRQVEHRQRQHYECSRYGYTSYTYSCGVTCRPSVCFGGSCSVCSSSSCTGGSTYCVMSRLASVTAWSDTTFSPVLVSIPTLALSDTIRQESLIEASFFLSLGAWRLGGRGVLIDNDELARYARISGPGHFLHGFVVR